jgi:chromosome segregation ATPase
MGLLLIGILGFILLMSLAIFIYMLPADKMPKRKRNPPPPPPVKEKDWETIAKRWEKGNALLQNEIESLKKERKSFLDKLDDNKKVMYEQTEQLAREKAWREKETQIMTKVKNVDHELKDDIKKLEKTIDEEHSLRLRLERDLQEFKIKTSKLTDQERALTVKIMTLEKELDVANKELRELKRTNTDLKKQKEDIQWVAKSDYDELVMKLKKVESELGRLNRDQQTPSA